MSHLAGLRRRFSATITSPRSRFLVERLTGRSLLRVHGAQSAEFLQSLITNDVRHLDRDGTASVSSTSNNSSAIFTMFLNKAGRVLYDTLVYRPRADADTYLIECDRAIDADLQKHLKIFRVRKKIDIDVISNELDVWVAFNPAAVDDELAMQTLQIPPTIVDDDIVTLAVADPRLKHLGTRIIAKSGSAATLLDRLQSEQQDVDVSETAPDADQHQLHRYRLGIGEGIAELPVAKCFPLESNADYLHGISFHKGCYLGQEFTARTHHTGVVRKRLLPVQFTADTPRLTAKSSRNVESTDGVQLGKVRGFHGDRGLALLKYETALVQESALVFGSADEMVKGIPARPMWWPQEAPTTVKK